MSRQDLRRRDDEDVSTLHRKVLAYETDMRRLVSELFLLQSTRKPLAGRLKDLQDALAESNAYVDEVLGTRWWKMRTIVRRLIGRGADLPRPDTRVEDRETLDDRYQHWLVLNAPRESDLERMRSVAACLSYKPKFSVLMPAYQTPERYLRAAIESVVAQTYTHWQLCIVDDASPSRHVADIAREYMAADPRIVLAIRTQNGHIAQASNTALEMATGEFIALLDHDDVLQPDALFENAVALNARPELDMLYSDEDKIDDFGRRSGPYFKPDWAPDTFLTKMYTSHLGVYRRTILTEIGGFRNGFEGAQDYDLVLRFTERTDRIGHIPRVLYSWRLHPASTSQNPQAKDYAYVNAQRAIADALDRRGEGGSVRPAVAGAGHWDIRYEVQRLQKVSVIIPTRNGALEVRRCLDSLFGRTTYPDYEVVLLDNGSDRADALALFAAYKRSEPYRFRYVRYDVPFNYAKINNVAVEHTSGRYLLFLNNDTEIVHGDWMTAMVEYAQRPSIGAVGAKLLYADATIQHAGVVLGIGGIAGHSHRHQPRTTGGYANNVALTTNYAAVTAACMMVRRQTFVDVGGFDETFPIAYNDVDFCLRLLECGLYNVCLPHVEVFHLESQSRGYDTDAASIERDMTERARLQTRWQQAWSNDPFYSPHLSLNAEDFRLAP